MKSTNPKLAQFEIAKEMKISFSTIQRYRRELGILSPKTIRPSSNTNHTRKQKTPHTKHDFVNITSNDLKINSNDLKMTSKDENDKPVFEKVKSQNKLRCGDPNDDNLNNGRDLIDQAFSSK